MCREMSWAPICTAPKHAAPVERIDLWAKKWISKTDEFEYQRFPDCYWRSTHWVGIPTDWHPTHWMPSPEPPEPGND